MSYEDVLEIKEKEAMGHLKAHKLSPAVYGGMEGCPEGQRFCYRNKMEYTFGDFVKDGELCLGMHKLGNFMSVVTVDHCQLVHPDFNRILRYTLDFAVENGLRHYHKKSHQGLLRNLVVRRGVRTNELLVNLVTSSEPGLDEQAWLSGLMALPLENHLIGVLHTINDDLADAVICDDLRILYGRDYYMEEICGLRFKVNAFSFFQTNVEAVERLYSHAAELLTAQGTEGKTVFDLYCGTGTISQIVATKAGRVVGVELVQDSVDAARENVRLNGIRNCSFLCGDVFKTLDGLEDLPDTIIVDPPRAGMREKAVAKIASYGVEQIVYVSCNPKTMAIDAAQFESLGYRMEYLRLYDNYPWTKHVETVVLLRGEKVDGHIEVDLNVEKLEDKLGALI